MQASSSSSRGLRTIWLGLGALGVGAVFWLVGVVFPGPSTRSGVYAAMFVALVHLGLGAFRLWRAQLQESQALDRRRHLAAEAGLRAMVSLAAARGSLGTLERRVIRRITGSVYGIRVQEARLDALLQEAVSDRASYGLKLATRRYLLNDEESERALTAAAMVAFATAAPRDVAQQELLELAGAFQIDRQRMALCLRRAVLADRHPENTQGILRRDSVAA